MTRQNATPQLRKILLLLFGLIVALGTLIYFTPVEAHNVSDDSAWLTKDGDPVAPIASNKHITFESEKDVYGGWAQVGTDATDFVLQVDLLSAAAADDETWQTDVWFRQYIFSTDSEGYWDLQYIDPETSRFSDVHKRIPYDREVLNLEANAANTILIVAHGDQGCLFINNTKVGELDLSLSKDPSNIHIGMFLPNATDNGIVTTLENLMVYEVGTVDKDCDA